MCLIMYITGDFIILGEFLLFNIPKNVSKTLNKRFNEWL